MPKYDLSISRVYELFFGGLFNLARSATGKKNLVNKGKQRQFPYLSLASKLDYNRFAVPDVIVELWLKYYHRVLEF